jgi:hypothetical protein
MSNGLGLSLKDARKRLSGLLSQRAAILLNLEYKGTSAMGPIMGPTEGELQNQLVEVDRRISEVRELYNTYMLESLDSESKKLSRLTAVLIALTAILAVLTLLSVVATLK